MEPEGYVTPRQSTRRFTWNKTRGRAVFFYQTENRLEPSLWVLSQRGTKQTFFRAGGLPYSHSVATESGPEALPTAIARISGRLNQGFLHVSFARNLQKWRSTFEVDVWLFRPSQRTREGAWASERKTASAGLREAQNRNRELHVGFST